MTDKPPQRLREARKKAGYRSASAAARAHGWQDSAYRHHENGTRNYGIEQALSYGRAFNVSSSWLLGIGDVVEQKSLEEFFEDIRLPRLPVDSTGFDETLAKTVGLHVIPEVHFASSRMELRTWDGGGQSDAICHALHRSLIKELVPEEHFHSLVFHRVADRTMAPTIEIGNLTLIDTAERVISQQDAIWAMSLGTAATIRRVRMVDAGTAMLTSDNPQIAAQEILLSRIFVFGRVAWSGRTA
jgi:hypothetical protein